MDIDGSPLAASALGARNGERALRCNPRGRSATVRSACRCTRSAPGGRCRWRGRCICRRSGARTSSGVARRAELKNAGVCEQLDVALADSGYWHQQQMDQLAGEGVQFAATTDDYAARRDRRPLVRRALSDSHGARRASGDPSVKARVVVLRERSGCGLIDAGCELLQAESHPAFDRPGW